MSKVRHSQINKLTDFLQKYLSLLKSTECGIKITIYSQKSYASDYLNNKMFLLVIHSENEVGDIARKIHNLR